MHHNGPLLPQAATGRYSKNLPVMPAEIHHMVSPLTVLSGINVVAGIMLRGMNSSPGRGWTLPY